ncbi:class I SAM-dependent methyltransferase [Paenibacillus sediminis]|uniref:O-methyltransferase YrrM n=1 Tax=Paenibacillus sediminis TaxID=664909 RepID=A0ABS4H377_9BACL|nr:class I SAM-dependent methyltransferase [Paenibacillus sediminis]MBP1936580.1 putative O-methyltransferase YrrM [Paenibacillus sediminis]
MDEYNKILNPLKAEELLIRASQIGFDASCDILTGNFLRLLVASRKQINILELGTGVGHSTAWILEGMDESSKLYSVEMNEECSSIAKEILGNDQRLELIVCDGAEYIMEHANRRFDIIFADTWPGKFYLLEEVLKMVKSGGIYIIDDLNPQPNWPEGHGEKVKELITYLESRDDFFISKLNWSTGLILMTRKV